MKKKVRIALLLSLILNICACNDMTAVETESTTQDLIKVQRDNYETAESEQPVEETTVTEKTNPVTDVPTKIPASTTTTTTTRTTQKDNKPIVTEPEDDEYDPEENVYNTTVTEIIESDDMILGNIKVKFYVDGYKPYDVNDFITQDMLEGLEQEEMAKFISDKISSSTPSSTVDFISEYEFGEDSYAFFYENFYSTPYYNIALEINELPKEKRKKENVREYEEWLIDIPINEKSNFEYKFKGVGLKTRDKIGSTEAEEGVIDSPDKTTQFYVELERDGKIISPQKVRNQNMLEDYATSLKAIALRLGEFENVTSRGYAKTNPILPLTFLIDNEKDKNEQFELTLGMPYKLFVDKFGEGTKIAKDVTDEETNEVSEEAYYVYKTKDYTLIIQKTEYEDIEKPFFYEEGYPDKPELISSIILVRNIAVEQEVLTDETNTNA